MKLAKSFLFVLFCVILPSICDAESLVYQFKMRLCVPRVYDNMQSNGYRKRQMQLIVGYVTVDKLSESEYSEPCVFVYDIVNKTHKVGNANVTYDDVEASDVMWHYIGNNKTGVFKNTCIKFNLDLDPSYNIGDDEPDNTILIQVSGTGSSERLIRGSVTGQIGCGCKEYGHVSPTRDIKGNVRDTAPLYGTFTMKLVSLKNAFHD